MRRHYELLQDTAFRRYTLSILLAMLGNGLTYITMIWVLLKYQPSVTATALLMTFFWLPSVLLGPVAGVISDRFDRKTLLFWTNAARAIGLGVFALLFWYHVTPMALYILAAFVGTVLALYIPASMSFVREIVHEKELPYANSLVDIATELGAVVGMGSAGLVLALSSLPMCFVINSICYVLATALIAAIPHKKKMADNYKEKETFLQEFYLGMIYLKERVSLMLVYVIQALFFISYMTTPVLLGPYARNFLHASVTQFGMLEAMLSLGIICGGISCPMLAEKFDLRRVVLVFSLLGLFSFYGFSHTLNLNWAIVFHFCIGLSFAVWALIITWAQEMTALDYQGRVHSLFNSVSGIVIIVFYYFIGSHASMPVAAMYWLEMGLMGAAVLLTLGMILYPKVMKKKVYGRL